MQLEESIRKMQDQWMGRVLQPNPVLASSSQSFKDGGVLPHEWLAELDAHIVRTQMLISSPYSASLLPTLRQWLTDLTQVADFTNLYKQVWEVVPAQIAVLFEVEVCGRPVLHGGRRLPDALRVPPLQADPPSVDRPQPETRERRRRRGACREGEGRSSRTCRASAK